MSDTSSDLRGVMIQVAGGRLMLPNGCWAGSVGVAGRFR